MDDRRLSRLLSAGQQMTELSPTLWTITMPLIGGQQFLIVPANNWNNKYASEWLQDS
jgi:hypothetical protein